MLNYVKAELYKVTHRLYPYLFLAVVLGIEVLLLGVVAFNNNVSGGPFFINFGELVTFLLPVLSMGLYFTFVVGDMVFSEQYKSGTLKNEISFGISRSRVYFGKLVAESIVGVVLLALVIGIYVLLCALLFPKDDTSLSSLHLLSIGLAAALPLYLGAMGVVHLCFSHLKSSTVASILPACLFALTGSFMRMALDFPLGLFTTISKVVYPFLLTTPFDKISPDIGGAFVLNAWCIGAGWLVASTVIGVAMFRKKEIN